jgi:hypothetical protein
MAGVPAELVGLLAGLVDDAAVFPPGNAPLAEAVAAYRGHRDKPYAALVGPLVVADSHLPELVRILEDAPGEEPLPVSVVVSGGAGGIEPVARWCDSPALELRAVEAALRDLDGLADSARRLLAAADAAGVQVPVYVEPPVAGSGSHGWLAALDEVAAGDQRLKLRTGGVEAGQVPNAGQVAEFIDAALDRELPFKCTAGLHHAVRHLAADAGFEHHGFLNILLATRAALDGEDVTAALEERDPDAVVRRLRAVGPEALGRTRRWFTSFGCCGVTEPWSDLLVLGLVGS